MKKKLKLILSIGLVSLSLTSCNTEEIGDRIQEVVNNMLPNLWVTLMQLAIFVFVAILFIFLAYKPLKKKMQKRADYIENNIKESEKKNLEASQNIEKSNEIIAQSQKKAGELIKAAQKTAEIKSSEFEKELSITLEKQKRQAHKDIMAEKEKMIKEAHEEIIDSAILASKEILKRSVTKEDNDKFVDDFVNELTKGNK